ncbi:class I SAM-dependent DNA methyltransferase [Microbacterium sp. NPDC058345]|uniref:HsdM family class I SAM-dependent methyltransferase n=1 Tax=Microbacterium sp. NPDC058345 TaxID=3346455 RepID=UPI0036617EEA
MSSNLARAADTPEIRKARGAFFTPDGITRHLAEWGISSATDRILEPSAGEAAFLTAAVARLHGLGAEKPHVHGVEIHAMSAKDGREIVAAAGGRATIRVADFFTTEPRGNYDVVLGNPPYIRYQDFSGDARDRARLAALQQGVALTGLASSWAAFVIHAAAHLKMGGKLGMVLPAELLSVNYAAPVRRYLLENFTSVELVVFDEQVFPDAMADTVLVKAAGYREGSTVEASLQQTRNATTLDTLAAQRSWAVSGTDRWHADPLNEETIDLIAELVGSLTFVSLETYGDTTLGAVTGNNRFFTMTPERAQRLGIPQRDLVRISPPGSAHLRGLALTESALTRLGQAGQATWLLAPSGKPAAGTLAYIESGESMDVHKAYKCRIRPDWWRVPLLAPPDLFLTAMNADTPRLTTNCTRARHLNSVHGVYLASEHRELAMAVLPVASLNSLTLLSAELSGRSYGGGILKLEPREADRWWMPSPALLTQHREELNAIKPRVQRLLQARNLEAAVETVDAVLFNQDMTPVRRDRAGKAKRRMTRGRSNG